MQTYKGMSNQWAIGVGLRRSTLYGTHRWHVWVNLGYRIRSVSWSMNPSRPMNPEPEETL